jgi:hypothetical protein
LLLNALTLATHPELVDLRPTLVEKDGSIGVEYYSDGALVGPSTQAAPAGAQLLLPGLLPDLGRANETGWGQRERAAGPQGLRIPA